MLPVEGQGTGGGQPERRSFEHPPGYQQNPYGGGMPGGQYGGAPQPSQSAQGGQSGQWHRAGDMDDNTGEESIWETAKKWATTAGGKLAETEAEIWKRGEMGWESGVIAEREKAVLARGIHPEIQERHVRHDGSTQERKEACFLGPRALIHAHIDVECRLEGDESGLDQRIAENHREATVSLPGNTRGQTT
ncbi:hypothetical protein V496_10553 [Pseudogymnoascus sp. VKM F-4515 (FW-2607)]|nr:hypothetical protein V496_10553 [Pseudogymnoascus sp. VKM F-4515 (FW-2607)]